MVTAHGRRGGGIEVAGGSRWPSVDADTAGGVPAALSLARHSPASMPWSRAGRSCYRCAVDALSARCASRTIAGATRARSRCRRCGALGVCGTASRIDVRFFRRPPGRFQDEIRARLAGRARGPVDQITRCAWFPGSTHITEISRAEVYANRSA